MKIRKLFYRALTVMIMCVMLLPWGSGSLSGTARAACPVTAENWHEVGTDSACAGGISDNNDYSAYPSVAIAPGGSPYVAWQDTSGGDSEIYVRRWTGSSWEEVGTGSATGGGISNNSGYSWGPSVAIAPDGTLYVAWADRSGGDDEIYVRRWNGSSWEEVGTDSASDGGISDNSGRSEHPSMAIAPDGTPYVAWDDESGGADEIYVRRWNGSSWEEVGTGSASGGGISDNSGWSAYPSVAIAPDGIPYVTWDDSSGGDREIYVKRWHRSSWEEVGTSSATGGGISDNSGTSQWASVAIAPDGTLYVTWEDRSDGDYEIYVRRWNGSSWEEVGTGSATGGGISDNSDWSENPSLAIAPDGRPYVAWGDASGGDYSEIYVRHWNGSSWEEVGAGSASGGGISDTSGWSDAPSVVMSPDGTPYVAWYDYSDGDLEIYVRRWGGSDTTPPAAITDLAASTGSAAGTVDLSWTAPGDDGNTGTAGTYIVRYAASAIGSELGWAAATDVDGEPTPQVAGSSESMTVSGLTPGQTYYFAIKTQDEVPNISGLSNSPSAVAGEGPTYSISGRVADGSNNPISGVTVTDSAGHTATTNSNGDYTLNGLTAGTYTITPSKSSYTFSPSSRTVSVPPSKTGQDFVATPPPPPCAVPFFSQRDDRWKDHPLRTNGVCSPACSTIGACGCTLTSSAMVFAYYGADLNPPTLSDCMGTSACPFSWAAGASCTNGRATWVNRYGFSWSRLDQELNQNNRPVILGMHRKSNSNYTHWVLVVSGQGSAPANYYMHDPWFLGGANMKLSARTQDYDLDWLAVYDGQPVCGTATSATSRPGAIEPQPVLFFAADLLSQSTPLTISEGSGLASSSVVSGTALVYSMTEVTMTVQLIAQSSAGNITEMLIWTDSMTNTTWQPFTSLVWLPVSDSVYARFRDEFGNVSEVQSDTIHPVASPPYPPFEIFLPLISKHQVFAPDLVVDSLVATSDAVTVTIKNEGNVPVTDEFWVDVYFNPNETPSLNQPWDTIASQGVVWGVTTPIAANGGTLTLTTGGDYYFPDLSSPAPLPVGADVYALVDSIDYNTTYGAVWESKEDNNLFGPVTSTASVAGEAPPVDYQGQHPSMEGLPPRR